MFNFKKDPLKDIKKELLDDFKDSLEKAPRHDDFLLATVFGVTAGIQSFAISRKNFFKNILDLAQENATDEYSIDELDLLIRLTETIGKKHKEKEKEIEVEIEESLKNAKILLEKLKVKNDLD